MLVFDVGANVGVKAQMMRHKGARVVCFEPQPDCAMRLRERFALDPEVVVVEEALGREPGAADLSVCDQANTISTMSGSWKEGRFKSHDWNRTISVQVSTLEAAIARFGSPDYCKVDVEGFELEVLMGLDTALTLLSFEFTKEFQDRATDCVLRLQAIGFTRFNLSYGETQRFKTDIWSDADSLIAELPKMRHAEAWGDIFATRSEVPRNVLALVSAEEGAEADDDTLAALQRAGLAYPGSPLRLHLGCGESIFSGYVNIDYPQERHNVYAAVADYQADVTTLRFPEGSVDEIRLHHVFEHFNRTVALAQLIKWHHWLKIGGRLVIETPDFEASAADVLRSTSLDHKLRAVRHLEGDQASGWAYHVGQWFPDRFVDTLTRLRFSEVAVKQEESTHRPPLFNVVATATKARPATLEDQYRSGLGVLRQFMVAEAEQPTFEVWAKQLEAALQGENAVPTLLHPVPAEASGLSAPVEGAASPSAIDKVLEGLEARSTPDLGRAQGFNAQARDHWVEARAASVEPGSKVLDVGAGTAPYRHLFGHCDYHTHDFAQYEGYQNGWEGDYAHIDYVSDILDIPVADASFDVILCTEVLEHVPRPVEALAEMARILRPGGRLLITAPLGSGLHQQPHHYYGGYTPHWYRKFLTEFGCDVVEITPNHGWFALLAQECARFSWSFDKHKHLHGEDGPQLSILLGDTLARYLYAQDERVFIPEFTVGYHVEAKRLTERPGLRPKPDSDTLRRGHNAVESHEARKERFLQEFRDAHYVRHNQRRQEHLASLGLPIEGRSVLELGAGIGDHTTFFIDRNCSICVSDGRPELYEIIKDRYHWMRTEFIDLETDNPGFNDVYDIVYAYGLLYHLNDAERALRAMARWCGGLLLLETCVSPRDDTGINPASEMKEYGSQAVSGTGCRPSRPWIFAELKRHFPHVYCTATQPWHPEFPLDWDAVPPDAGLTRAVFVASRTPLDLPSLLPSLPGRQVRH